MLVNFTKKGEDIHTFWCAASRNQAGYIETMMRLDEAPPNENWGPVQGSRRLPRYKVIAWTSVLSTLSGGLPTSKHCTLLARVAGHSWSQCSRVSSPSSHRGQVADGAALIKCQYTASMQLWPLRGEPIIPTLS